MSSSNSCVVGSLLEKPLSELTEEDIAQLTREDCRRFLKLKGMRRPSWNKSQAIQQVISLKALLDDRPDPRNLLVHHHPTTPPVAIPSTTRAAEDPSPYRRRDPNTNPNPIPTHAIPTCSPRPNHAAVAHREEPTQMTIFYNGSVNIYNKVPVDRASAIMRFAASPIDLNEPPAGPVLASSTVHSQIYQANASPVDAGPLEGTHAPESEDGFGGFIDCPKGRQASLQRYREKRKDRYKGKRTIGSSPSGLEMMFLSHKVISQNPNEQSSLSNMSSLTQLRAPCSPTRCSSIENQAQKFRISIDLNDYGGCE